MIKTWNPIIKETLYGETMDNGLRVFLMPKEGFSKTYGMFATDFGSVDTTFVPLGEDKIFHVTDGVAHFLEHKMFDMKDGDASERFARLGAASNAFTSNTRTAYLFSTTAHEMECTELLLDFVQSLDVTEASVDKEKGIIAQEIGMYDDNPDWQVYFGAIRNLYHNHPVKIDIAGTVESIQEIDVALLKRCYDTFYHPSNMVLFVVGHFDAEDMMAMIRVNQAKKGFTAMAPVVRAQSDEPRTILNKSETRRMDVSMPKVCVAMKINAIPESVEGRLKQDLAFGLLTDMCFSKSSPLRYDWVEKGLINDSFSAGYTQERDYAFYAMDSETDKPEELKDTFYDFIRTIKNEALDKTLFERAKKRNIGTMIQVFNSPETIANMFTRYIQCGVNMLDLIAAIQAMTLDDLKAILPLFDDKLAADFTILPTR